MTELTPIDHAHARMQAAPDDEQAQLAFFERLADSALFLMLEREAVDAQIEPRVFPVEETPYVLAFDREARLAEFAGKITPYAELSGRALAGMLAGQGMGLGVNLGGAPSETLLPPEAVSWLAQMLEAQPDTKTETPIDLAPPAGLPEVLITSLDTKLAMCVGLAEMAYLCSVTYEGGVSGHILAFVDAVPGSEGALAQAVTESLVFSGIEAGSLDVAFFKSTETVTASLARVGLRFDLPKPQRPAALKAPGSDPTKPPRLR